MTDSTQAPRNRIPLLRLAGTVLALGLLIYLLGEQGWHEIGIAIRNLPIGSLVIAFLLTIISRLAIGVRWHILIHEIEPRISLKQALRLTFVGLYTSNFLPTTIGGDAVRLTGAIQLKFDAVLCAASLVMDRLIGIAGMLMVLPFGLPKLFEDQSLIRSLPLESFEIIIVTGLMVSAPRSWLRKILNKSRQIFQKLINALSYWLSHPRALLLALVFTWIHMLCLFGSIYVMLRGLNNVVPIWSIAGLWSMVYFITLIPISINGYGVQELSTSFLFTQVGGISPQNSLTIALLIRTLQMVVSLPGALFLSRTIVGSKDNPA